MIIWKFGVYLKKIGELGLQISWHFGVARGGGAKMFENI